MHRFIKLNHFIFYLLSLLSFSVFAAQQVKETRVWPSPEYTRITIESSKEIKKTHLNRFETRKVIFSSDALEIKDLSKGMLEAINFELLWLKNKKNYYGSIFQEDDKRIKMLSDRWKV